MLLALTLLAAALADLPADQLAIVAQDAVTKQARLFDDIEKHCFVLRINQEEPGDDPKRKKETRLEHVCFRDGVPVYKRLEINGRLTGVKLEDPFPPPDDEWRKRAERIREARKTQIDVIQQCLKAFKFTYVTETVVEDRPVYVLDFAPDPDYKAISRTTEMLKSARGRAWVDKETHNVVRVQAHTFRDFNIWGGLLAKIKEGATFEMRQRPVGGVWLAYALDLSWEGRLAMLKRIGDKVHMERSDFKVGSADSYGRKSAQ